MSLPPIISVSGYATSGKNEVTRILHEEYGYKQVAFADKLKQLAYVLNPIVDIQPSGWVRVSTLVDKVGDTKAKENREYRRLLQKLGTEGGREILGENVWVNAALDIDAPLIAVSDCRFPNELEAVMNRGGKTIHISRPGVGPINAHISETALDSAVFDCYIVNDGNLEELRTKVVGYIHTLVGG